MHGLVSFKALLASDERSWRPVGAIEPFAGVDDSQNADLRLGDFPSGYLAGGVREKRIRSVPEGIPSNISFNSSWVWFWSRTVEPQPIPGKGRFIGMETAGGFYKRVCPVCSDGVLLVGRDRLGRIVASDHCVACGQPFWYADLAAPDGTLAVVEEEGRA